MFSLEHSGSESGHSLRWTAQFRGGNLGLYQQDVCLR